MTTIFTRDESADTNGTSLQLYLETATVAAMRAVFGAPDKDAYIDEEAGYTGDEWHFASNDGRVFNVYARWGSELRVGAHGNCTDFAAWLLAETARTVAA